MLNAGNIDGAIEKIGCSVESHENVVASVTMNFEIKLNNSKRELEYVRGLVYSTRSDIESHSNRIKSLEDAINSLESKIQSMKERLNVYKDSVCGICYDDFDNPTAVKCCQNVFCFQCITRCLGASGCCPMCRKKIDNENLAVISAVPKKTVCDDLPSKHNALSNLLQKQSDGKFLIFSSHDQSFTYIESALKQTGHEVIKLMGSVSRVKNILNRYKHGDLDVLMLNSSHYGTGLNLENTTDLVFYHKMPRDMEKQVIGRAQRAGRESPLRIHYLYQENEINQHI
jgi:SNF2 family DNA or RNA helicase